MERLVSKVTLSVLMGTLNPADGVYKPAAGYNIKKYRYQHRQYFFLEIFNIDSGSTVNSFGFQKQS